MPNLVLLNAPGPQGAQGKPGAPGSNGINGVQDVVLDLASSAVSVGQGVVFKNGRAVLASQANLTVAQSIAGIALTNANPGAGLRIITNGAVDPSLFSLGSGPVCSFGLDLNGKPVRVTDPVCVSGLKHGGYVDSNGALFVQPHVHTVYELEDFGFVGDGVIDNLNAWNTMMSVIGNGDTFAPTAVAQISAPSGNFYFSGALNITRCIRLTGPGMGAIADTAPCAFVFPQGVGGLIMNSNTASVASSFSIIEDIAFYGSSAVGSIRPSPWKPSHKYIVGDVVMPNYYDTAANSGSYPGGLMAWAFVCTVSGTSSATEPSWPVPVPPLTSTTQSDGGVTWKCVGSHGLEIRQGYVKAIRCRFYGFAGNGIHAVASTTWGTGWQSSGGTIDECDCSLNGGNGIALGGFDGNAITIINATARDNRGYGIRDQSGLGCAHVGGQVAGNVAGGIWANSSSFLQPYSESGNRCTFRDLAQVLGGVFELSGDFVQTRANATHYTAGDYMRPASTASTFTFVCLTSGTTSGSEPDFTTINGSPMAVGWNDSPQSSITDGSCVWVCYGTQEPCNGLIMGHALPFPGTRPFIVNQPSGSPSVQIGLGARASSIGDSFNPTVGLSFASSDDSNFTNPFYFALDAANNRWYWTYTTSAGNRFLEFTRASASPEGQGQITFPNGIWTGNRALDALASSYFGPNKLRLSGGIDAHGGHYLGDRETSRDGALTTDATTTTACAFSLPNDSTNGALTELCVKVLAKEISTGSDCAVFELRGSWYRKDSTVVQVAAPEVVYGKPTDASHCTAGATTWTAVLLLSSTSINVQVTGAAGHEIHWYVTRESDEGTRT